MYKTKSAARNTEYAATYQNSTGGNPVRNDIRKMNKSEQGATTSSIISRRFLPWLLILFVGSGCAALIYEVVWLQLLQLVIGSTGVSMGVLLGTFMGGMCLGSLLLPRLISSVHHPLRVYAFLELGIGVIGIAILFGMPYLADMYEGFMGHGIIDRAVVSFICLIPPTLLMGATLPAIARCVKATPEGVSWMGYFYAGNTGGAVLGCLLAGFYLLRVHDMPTATYTALAINVLVAMAALALAARMNWEPVTAPAKTKESPVEAGIGKLGVYITIGLSGLSALGAEVVWTRLLSLMLGATVYTFSIILAMFLTGLGIGSSAGSFLARRVKKARVSLGVCQIFIAGAAAWAALIINRIPYWPIDPIKITKQFGPWYMFFIDILMVTCAVLPAAILWGASFPLALAAVSERDKDTGRMVGGVYAANTLGAIVGSLAFSMLVIPQVGTRWGQRFLIIIAAISSLVALMPSFASRQVTKKKGTKAAQLLALSKGKLAGAFFSLAAVVLMVILVSPVPWIAVAFGRYSSSYVKLVSSRGFTREEDVPVEPSRRSPLRYCLYVGEGMNVSVAVTKNTAGWRYFHGAGKVQASSNPQDMRLQRMLGHLSVLTRSDPDDVKEVLVVACGAGVTAGSFIPYPNIERITICDIEPLVPKVVTPMFGKENYHIVDGIDKENPHRVEGKEVRVVYDDGRHYIRTLPKDAKFDIITSDPIDPWVKGCAALNTVEYYQMCKEHLKPGGVMTLWMPLYESDQETIKSLISTFFKVFPNGMFFSNDLGGVGYDAILLGGDEPTTVNLDGLQKTLDTPEYAPVKESLMEVGYGADTKSLKLETNVWGDPAIALLATYAGRAADLGEWMKNAQINTDKNMRLQYLAGMAVNEQQRKEILDGILKYYKFPEDAFIGSQRNIEVMKQALQSVKRGQQ
jgi:spermidine synthase